MVIELETGARSDGTLLARRARLVLDSGAYCGEGGFFAQMAAMHALGPYELENVDVESSLVYSNNQPSSSIRAPTAPQVCWALEQHMDELAEALGLDPVELRRRTLIEDGLRHGHGPGARADRDEGDARAGGRADRRRRGPARGRGDRHRVRLVAVLRGERRRLRQAQRRRHRHDRHRRAGERHRRGDGDAALRGGGARHAARRTSRSSTRTRTPRRGTWARAARRRRSTACAPSLAATDDVRDQLLDAGIGAARGGARRPRARRGLGARQGLARQVRRDRRARGRRHVPREGRRRGRRRRRPLQPRAASDGSASSRSTRRS